MTRSPIIGYTVCMTQLRIITDADLADMAPHIAERAQAELVERAECNDDAVAALEAVDELLSQLPSMDPDRDRRKHDDECWKRHTDCLAVKIGALIRE